MKNVEICMIVTDSLAALKLYEAIFDVERIEVTNFSPGNNEVVFTIFGTRFHLLDERPELNMIAPKEGDSKPIWYNITVPKITETYQKALAAGCIEISPITEMESHGIKTAMFFDAFGFIWQLHEIVHEVSFEERVHALKDQLRNEES